MPRYYFELHNDAEVTDEEGMELSDQAAAHAVALKSIAGILADKIAGVHASTSRTALRCWTRIAARFF